VWSPQPRQSDEYQDYIVWYFAKGGPLISDIARKFASVRASFASVGNLDLHDQIGQFPASIKSVTHDFASSIYFHPNYCDTSSPQDESASSGLDAGWSTSLLDLCNGIYTIPGTETFPSETLLAQRYSTTLLPILTGDLTAMVVEEVVPRLLLRGFANFRMTMMVLSTR